MPWADVTPDELAKYSLKWVYDFGWPALCYADRYPIDGALYEDLEAMIDDGASETDIKLVLHELATMYDEEDTAREEWRTQHPIRHAVSQLGWHLQMWGSRPWRESLQ